MECCIHGGVISCRIRRHDICSVGRIDAITRGAASNGQGGGMVNIFGHMQVERSIPNHPPNDIRIDSKYLTFNVDSSSLPHNLLDAISTEVQRQTTQRVGEKRNEEKKTKKR